MRHIYVTNVIAGCNEAGVRVYVRVCDTSMLQMLSQGVMKLVGEAVRGTSFGSQIITIGVATWGIIRNREQLVGSVSLHTSNFNCLDPNSLFQYPISFISVTSLATSYFTFFLLLTLEINKYLSHNLQAHNQKLVRDYETKKDRVSEERRGAFLDPNHTHFLLVDNGINLQIIF